MNAAVSSVEAMAKGDASAAEALGGESCPQHGSFATAVRESVDGEAYGGAVRGRTTEHTAQETAHVTVVSFDQSGGLAPRVVALFSDLPGVTVGTVSERVAVRRRWAWSYVNRLVELGVSVSVASAPRPSRCRGRD